MSEDYLGFFVNGYQPPTQSEQIIEDIYKTSYEPLISFLEKNKHVFLSIYLAKSLGERLPHKFLERIQVLYLKQQAEILGGTGYHPILALIPEKEVKRQLTIQEEFLRDCIIGDDPLPGIFIPELAYSPNLPRIFKECGYHWFITDDHPYALSRSNLPPDERISMNALPEIDGCGALLRSRLWSGRIAWGEYTNGQEFAKDFIKEHKLWKRRRHLYDGNFDKPSFAVIGLDWETFGHHLKGAIREFLLPFFKSVECQTDSFQVIPLHSIYSRFQSDPALGPIPAGSWSTDNPSIPFPRWNHPDNPYHRAWNEFIRIVFEIAPENPEPELRELLDKFAFSCPPWWATKDDPKDRTNAGWCLPYFQRIVELLSYRSEKNRLNYLTGEMRNFIKINTP